MIQQSIIPTTKSNVLLHAQGLHNLFSKEGLSLRVKSLLHEIIYDHYHANRRSFSWREQISPYRVVVSEIMLQQTQTFRVATKFDAFIQRFDSFQALAAAPFEEVLRYWKGLGYNRRALNLQKIAQLVVAQHAGELPNDPVLLETFPGIGKATAASICAFAFDRATTFIETNIRTVFIHFFYPAQAAVHDKELMPLIAHCLDEQEPRQWYYALMDYGVMLKKEIGNVSQRSAHYAKQSKFEGSDRQVRGKILEVLLKDGGCLLEQLVERVADKDGRTERILEQLLAEGFVKNSNGMICLQG